MTDGDLTTLLDTVARRLDDIRAELDLAAQAGGRDHRWAHLHTLLLRDDVRALGRAIRATHDGPPPSVPPLTIHTAPRTASAERATDEELRQFLRTHEPRPYQPFRSVIHLRLYLEHEREWLRRGFEKFAWRDDT